MARLSSSLILEMVSAVQRVGYLGEPCSVSDEFQNLVGGEQLFCVLRRIADGLEQAGSHEDADVLRRCCKASSSISVIWVMLAPRSSCKSLAMRARSLSSTACCSSNRIRARSRRKET